MADLILSGSTSGTVTVSSPAVSGSSVLTLPVATDTLVGKATTDTLTNKTLTAPAISSAVMTTMASSVLTSATAQNSTSGTSIDFTGIPSWVKRVTVMFNGVSTSGSSHVLIRIGAGSVDSTSYTGITVVGWSGVVNYSDTSGFPLYYNTNTYTLSGAMVLTTIGSNIWVISGTVAMTGLNGVIMTGGSKTLSSTLDRVRITTVNGTDTFDAGSINLMYE